MPWFDMTYLLRGLVLVWFAVVGACVGSFLNVVVYRLPAGLNLLRPGSRCPFCASAIAARDNIPILSWLMLRGRCRRCHLPIASRYPWVELSIALIFVLLAMVWLPPRSLYYRVDATVVRQLLGLFTCLALLCTWIAAALIDWDGQPVPPKLFTPLGLVAGVNVVICLGSLFTSSQFIGFLEPSVGAGAGNWCVSLLGGMMAGLLAALVIRTSPSVFSLRWATLLVLTGSLVGLHGFVAIWLVSASGCLLWAVWRRLAGGVTMPGSGVMLGWTVAMLGWSAVVGAGSVRGVEMGDFVRIASSSAVIDGTWVLVVGGTATLVSLLTPRG